MSKAEERALEAYPYNRAYTDNDIEYDGNFCNRLPYIEGYRQAEKDLELTNEDVYDIWRIYNEVCAEGEILGFDETSQEVLKRFKTKKEE